MPEPASPLQVVSATLGALDLPAFVLSRDAGVLYQNKAAVRAFDIIVPGAHISARLRSPGILDMVREHHHASQKHQMRYGHK